MTVLLTTLLTAVAMIPRSAIQENVQKSAEFLCESELFGNAVEGVYGSKIDRYADSILLAIAYQYDEEEPLSSVMWSSYYYTSYQNENENLLDAVSKDLEANQQYLRYWHGSNVVVRPLLMFFSIEQIYVLNGIVLAGLCVVLLVMFIKERAWGPMIGLLAGVVLTSSWFVPLSLEYTWTYILMLVMSICCWKWALLEKQHTLNFAFLIAGMLTNFVDFLTTETLTLLVPLLLVVWISLNRNSNVSIDTTIKNTIKRTCLWGFGYVGMWLMKWCMASVVLQQNVMPYVTEHIAERTTGDVGLGIGAYILSTIGKNMKCLFPFEYGELGTFLGFAFCAIVCYVGYVYRKKNTDRKQVLLYGIIGIVPFVRYLVLLNHSYLHAFFTYRAQLATILAIAMILVEVVEWRWLIHADERKRKS